MTASVSNLPSPVIPGAAPAAASSGASATGGALQGFDAMLAALFGVVDAAGVPTIAGGAKDGAGDKAKTAEDSADATQPPAEAQTLAALLGIPLATAPQPQVPTAPKDDAASQGGKAAPSLVASPPIAPDAAAPKSPTAPAIGGEVVPANSATQAALAKLAAGADSPPAVEAPPAQAAVASGAAPSSSASDKTPPPPVVPPAQDAAIERPPATQAGLDQTALIQTAQAAGEVATPKTVPAPARDRQAGRAGQADTPPLDATAATTDLAAPTAPAGKAAAATPNPAAKTETIAANAADDVAPAQAGAGHEKAEPADPKGQAPAPAVVDLATPVPTHAATVQVRGSPETVAQLAAQIVKKLDGRSTRFDVELDPAGLGKVDVRIEIGAQGRMTAAMSFDTPQAAAELRNRSNELHRALEQAGFNLNPGGLSFDVAGDRGQGGRQLFDQQQQQQQNSGDSWRGRAFEAALATAGEASDTALQSATRLQSRRSSGVDIRI